MGRMLNQSKNNTQKYLEARDIRLSESLSFSSVFKVSVSVSIRLSSYCETFNINKVNGLPRC